MTRTTMIFVLCAALLLSVTSVMANVEKDRELQALNSPNDVAPQAGPVAHFNPSDDMWDMIWFTNAGVTVGDNQLLGGEFANGQYYVTGGNSAADPNKLYILDADGNLLNTVDQWSAAGWGWRDLAYDGTYLYASDDAVVDAFDLNGVAVPGMNITVTGGISVNRALAYDPVTDHFWSKSFSENLIEFDRSGAVLWSGAVTAANACYGAAWDDGATDGPWLWLFDQTGSPQTTILQFDPVNHIATGVSYVVPLVGASTAQLAGGLFFTDETTPGFYTMGGVTQGTPDDMIFLLEMYVAADPNAPAAPGNFTVTPDAGGALTVDLAWDLPTTNVGGGPLTDPITSVEITRDGAPYASLGATATSYTDNVGAAGEYAYGVYCVNNSGNGLTATGSAWAGLDVPDGVSALTGAGVGTSLEAEISWTNPTMGAHGGYFPAGSIDGYTINRYGANPATFDLVGLNTMYTDTDIPGPGFYSYGVVPYNSSGSGPEMMTDEFYVGPAPYEPTAYNWVEINPAHPGYDYMGTNTGITSDDQNAGPFALGFAFPWYDAAFHSTIRVCSNGWASFTSTSTAYSNAAIPSTGLPNDLVAPYWDDMNPSSYGSVWYYADPGNQFFVVEWDSCAHFGSTGSWFTFEAILYATGDIEYMYKALQPGTGTFPSATVGIENATGTDGIQCTYNGSGPLEPDESTGIVIYSVGGAIPDVTVTLTPVGLPIVIPASGGIIDFNIAASNNETTTTQMDIWTDVTLPNGSHYGAGAPGFILLEGFNAPGSWTGDRDRDLTVPAGAPDGAYSYNAYVGAYPDVVWATDSFPWEKSLTGDGPSYSGWATSGESFDEWMMEAPTTTPATFALIGAYPNPFNPTSTISYALPQASKVTLRVYDLQGRMVTELANGYRDAGVHQAIFDGTGLASGVYIYSLQAGDFSANGKMIMMK